MPVTFWSNKGTDGPSAVEPHAQVRLCRSPRGRRGGIREDLEGLTAFIVAPAPARWLAFQPTGSNKQAAKDGDIGKINTELCAGWKKE